MPFSNSFRETIMEGLFGLGTQYTPSQLSIRVTSTINHLSAYGTVDFLSRGALDCGSSGVFGNFWVWDSSLDSDSDSIVGGIKNATALAIPITTASTVSHWALVDSTQSEVLFWGALPTTEVVAVGDTITIASGALKIELD